ncbi:hypothetical protein [Streptomyces sp. NRRL F-5727]|uniref:hypothetical protein n=1 Tax=Streptomyces sp. NRRL F-5727 TaxID=1463871 RepID=UPI0004C5A938|nr:hypothetical protein [Streptomyces sp. NRRL F-5727]
MNPPVTDDALLDAIAQHLDQLADHLLQADARQAAQILARVVDLEDGVLRKLTDLVTDCSRASRNHAADGLFPPEAWLAFGRAGNTLANVSDDLDQHRNVFEQIGKQAPASAPPKATAFVTRGRHR